MLFHRHCSNILFKGHGWLNDEQSYWVCLRQLHASVNWPFSKWSSAKNHTGCSASERISRMQNHYAQWALLLHFILNRTCYSVSIYNVLKLTLMGVSIREINIHFYIDSKLHKKTGQSHSNSGTAIHISNVKLGTLLEYLHFILLLYYYY